MRSDAIDVLVVDRLESAAETVRHLEDRTDEMRLQLSSDVSDARRVVEADDVDCVVSNFEIPRPDGIEFVGAFELLRTVREVDPDLPFVLFTDVGNEAIAETAIARGVTEYVPRTATEHSYRRLIGRVERAVEYRRADRRAERQARINEVIRDVNQSLVRAADRSEIETMVCDQLAGDRGYSFAWWGTPGGDRLSTAAVVCAGDGVEAIPAETTPVPAALESDEVTVASGLAACDDWTVLTPETPQAVAAVPITYQETTYGVVVLGSTAADGVDETERTVLAELGDTIAYAINATETRTALRRQNERLDTFASIVSHDLRNPLGVAQAYLGELGAEADAVDDDAVEAIDESLDRMEELVADVLQLAREGRDAYETAVVDLGAAVDRAWSSVETADATLRVGDDCGYLLADESRLAQLLENLFRNSVEHGVPRASGEAGDPGEHGGDDVTVTVGRWKDGFYVADDGAGIPEKEREQVLESGYSSADGTGLGLAIVESVAAGHGWSVTVTESESGGARFEFTGVDRP
ncbi:hybrid sensor histidine kinase/response regulator [Haloarchaeobius amylolyticus]|uniref:hybrid sensor histidine kinase/response regulator n=1 Tax=Haloarchaeobius amylolyticus TaxID=1198296 RepID=UPI00227137C4|nr:ATP-binding protein [Haloarchaeobius amylolyticus]